MGRILFFLVALIAVVFAVLLVVPGVVPVAAYKDRVEMAASGALGREITMDDNLSIKIIPRTAFIVNNLTIANAEGFDGPYLAKIERADIGIKLLPLLSGAVNVERFVLTNPDINLIRKANGSVNWNLANADEPQAGNDTGSPSAGRVGDVQLGDVRIEGGQARYQDRVAGKDYAATDLDLRLILSSLNNPFEARGTLTVQNEPAKVDLVLTTLRKVLDGEPANMKLDMTIGSTTAGTDLTVRPGDVIEFSGPVQLDAPDLPALAALTGTSLSDAPGFDSLAVSGNVDGNPNGLRLSDATINFDDIDAVGVLNLDWTGTRPKASGVLSAEKLDLRPYMPPPAESVNGFPAWSSAPMNFDSLRNVDADFDISTNAIFVNDLEFGESRLKLRLDNGRMVADIPELAMYGGQGSGQVVVNARGQSPSFSGNFDVGSVNAQPLSADLMKHDNLLGLGSFNLNFTAAGASQADIMSSMNGKGGFDLADGALKGINIAGIVRGVNELQTNLNPAALISAVSQARGPSQQTDYQEFLSDFTITNGLVNAPTITLNGAFITMSGNGNVNLPAQTIDLRLSPRATSKAFGEGGKALTIPLRIGGTFSKPTVAIDAEALFRSGAENQVRGILDGVLGGKDDGEGEGEGEGGDGDAAQSSPEDVAKRALEGILGGSKKETAPTDDQSQAAEPSLEEELINTGLGAIFGSRKKSEEETQDGDE